MSGKTRHPRGVRERAVALVFEQVGQYSSQWEAIESIAGKVGVSAETLRRAKVDAGSRPGTTSEDALNIAHCGVLQSEFANRVSSGVGC
jgi:transposase